jgi:hypothetical protein
MNAFGERGADVSFFVNNMTTDMRAEKPARI